eukprot:403357692
MYLPTFWKLTTEATMYRFRHVSGYVVPISFLITWIMFPSLYNWTFSCIIPPPRGVPKRAADYQ